MFLFKKKIYLYLYIFFLILVFIFSKFSTNLLFGKNLTVYDVEVNESYDLNFNKSKVIDKAFVEAYDILINKVIEKKDRFKLKKVTIKEIKSLVDNFSIIDEKFVNNQYQSKFEVQFNRNRILKFLEKYNIIFSIPKKTKTFILPILVDSENNEIYYLNQNIFYNNWNNVSKKHFLIEYVLPNEDIEDYFIIKKNIDNIENYNFEEIISKYNLENNIILVILKKNNKLRLFSKIKFDKKNMLINSAYDKINLKNNEDVNNLIFDIKEKYEDKWKSINQLNTSISLPIRLSFNSKNMELINKFENTLINMDLVSEFKIEKFNNNKIYYKIIYGSNPNKFLDEMLLFNFKIDTSNEIWTLK